MLALSLTTDSFTATLFPLLLRERKFMETSWECSPDNLEAGLWRVQITEQTVANDDKKQAAVSHMVIWHSTQQMFSKRSTVPTKHCDQCLSIGKGHKASGRALFQ